MLYALHDALVKPMPGNQLAPSLALPSGGSLHIAETPAAVLIDVDTGTPEGGSAERGALAEAGDLQGDALGGDDP